MFPKVSVGLPVRNGGRLLSRAIQSILAQDFGDLELLISDNASDDATADICAEYARLDNRVRIFRHDRAVTSTLNFEYVLDHTAGKMFMWAAHDDRRAEDCVRRHVEALHSNPRAILAISDIATVDEVSGSRSVYKFSELLASDDPIERIRFILRENGWGAIYGLFRRDALARCRRLSSIPRIPNGISVDYSVLELALMGPFVYIPESLTECAIRGFDPSAIVAKIGTKNTNRAVLWWLLMDSWAMSGQHHLPIQKRFQALSAVLETALHGGTMNQYLRSLNFKAIEVAIRDNDFPSLLSLWLERAALRARS
jgi:glycosyltransferase involved in cell wall biosynthesis